METDVPAEEQRLRPPSWLLMLAEPRALFEFNSSLFLSPLLMQAPRGDGHPVLALPGFLASDLSSAITGEVIYVDSGYNIMAF